MKSTHPIGSSRHAALWAVAMCALGVAAIAVVRSDQPAGQRADELNPPSSLSDASIEKALTLEERWVNEASLTPVASVSDDDLLAAFAVSLHDPDALASDSEKQHLAAAIVQRLGFLTDTSPERFIAEMRHDRTRAAIAPDAPDYSRLRSVYQYELGEELAPDADHETLVRELWAAIMEKKGYTLAEIGQGERGVATHLYRARTLDQISTATLVARGMDGAYWFAQPISMTALPLYPPVVSVEEYAREHDSALIAASHFIARFTNGNLCGVGMLWYYDEGADEWVCYNLVSMGTRGMRLFL